MSNPENDRWKLRMRWYPRKPTALHCLLARCAYCGLPTLGFGFLLSDGKGWCFACTAHRPQVSAFCHERSDLRTQLYAATAALQTLPDGSVAPKRG